MQYTSAQANKLLRKLKEELHNITHNESVSREFVAATTERLEDARPAYDYAETQKKITVLEKNIRTVKHCINVFNMTHTVEGFDMTVDQMLVYIPQLTDRKCKLLGMATTLPKKRITPSARSNLIEYQYANFDVSLAKSDLATVSAELAEAQIALDKLNNGETFEIELGT